MTQRGPWVSRPLAALLCILLVALLARAGALWVAGDAQPVLDEKQYVLRAEGLLDGRGLLGSYQSWVRHDESPFLAELPQYPGAYQPPGYPVFVAAILAISGRSVWAVKFAQVLLGTLTVALVYWIARSWLGPRRGLLAAGLCALYPNLIAFSHYLWSETLFIFLVLLAFGLLTTRDAMPSRRVALLAGLVLGVSALTRSMIVSFLPVLLAWLVFVNRRAWRVAVARSLLVVLGMAVTISPWTLRNQRVHDGFVLIDTNGAFNLWRGNVAGAYAIRPMHPGLSYGPPFHAIPLMPVRDQEPSLLIAQVKERLGKSRPTDLEVVACARQLAWESIRDDPRGFARRALYKVIDMWNPTSFVLRHFRLGAYGPAAPWVERSAGWAAVLGYLVVMGFGAIGLVAARRDSRAWLVLAWLLYCTAISAVAFGLTRFRLPVMPLLMVFASHGIATVGTRLAGRAQQPAAAAATTD